MRIAMLTNNYKPYVGGVPISIERLANGLRSLGHEVYIFAPSYREEAEEPYVIRCHSRKKKLRGEFVVPDIFDPVIEEFFSSLSFDMIHVHHPMLMGYTAQYLGRKYHIPVVFTYHTRYEQYLHYLLPSGEKLQKLTGKSRNAVFRSLEKKILYNGSEKLVIIHNRIFTNQCNLVFAPTPGVKQYLKEHGTSTEVEIMPTGLSENDFEFSAKEAKRIRKKYIEGKTYLLCTVSRLEKEKNIKFILKGLKQLKEKAGDCFRLLILGEGSLKAELNSLAVQLGLGDNIIFCGCIPHDKLQNYYHACDLFLFASQSETQGIVLLEAMAAGLPVIAVRATGVSDVVKEGKNGFMTGLDIDLWEEKIELVLTHPDVKKRMQKEAIKEAKQYCAIQVAKSAEQYYQIVLFKSRAGHEQMPLPHQGLE